ncbi:MAG: putative transporter [bacterium ADurb.Bin212]|nr:MAG: putative transporter [bacterium ADurb.Bin212]
MIGPIEVKYIQTLTDSGFLIGLSYAVGTVVFALLSVWLGRHSDRAGRRNYIIVGLALGVLHPLLFASVFNMMQFIGVKIVWAAASVATGPIFMAHIQHTLSGVKNKGSLVGAMFAVQSALGAGSSIIGGYVADLYGLKAPYYLMTAVFVITLIYAMIALEKGKNIPDEKVDASDKRHLLDGIHYVFKRPALIYYFIYNAATSINWGIKGMLWPLIIYDISGRNSTTGSIFATMGIVAFCSLIFIGKIVDKHGEFKSATYSILLLAVSGAAFIATHNLYILWVAASVYALGESLWGPSQMVILTDHVDSSRRGEVLAIDALFDRAYNTLAPILAGLLLGVWNPRYILIIYVSLFAFAYIAGRVYLKKHQQDATISGI